MKLWRFYINVMKKCPKVKPLIMRAFFFFFALDRHIVFTSAALSQNEESDAVFFRR